MARMRRGGNVTTCWSKALNTEVEESKTAIQISGLHFTGLTPADCSPAVQTLQQSPTSDFPWVTQECLIVQSITTEREDVYLYLWFLFYNVRKRKESLQGAWSYVKWTKQSSSDAVIPLKASLGFQSCCTCENKNIQYCSSLPLLCFQHGVILGWTLKQRFPNSKPGTYS